eukprot:TRINITY_DN33517_c0_g1_i1.p1 TRINITY_DN33517_c0_g1~~TRINITY_DN33517_c0_g1_i1.p1  ORF type:complete len:297 (+),score=77.58 TRINITY_DN33517_c0_g1_i1:13-903(+)
MKYPELSEVDTLGYEELKVVLRNLRQRPVRRSELVVRCGERVMNTSGLGQEKWAILEQVAIASLDIMHFALAEECLAMLATNFGPDGKRVSRLRGMVLEAKGLYDEAVKVYNKILEAHPSDRQSTWRKVAILKAQKKHDEAVREIEKQLSTVAITAEEGYLELLNMHVLNEKPEYGKAVTACEELILQDPTNYAWLMLYAELLYTIAAQDGGSGRKPSLLLSRKYYSESILNNDGSNNTRSVWGLLQTCRTVAPLLSTPSEKEENTNLRSWAETRLKSLYNKVEGSHAGYSLTVSK